MGVSIADPYTAQHHDGFCLVASETEHGGYDAARTVEGRAQLRSTLRSPDC